ncbi:hypothetical protein [Myroides odoratus]|uniref:hypothetical protein n=1 Tax=Myroides odoratus TaxID=256 RepID=UPI0039B092DF
MRKTLVLLTLLISLLACSTDDNTKRVYQAAIQGTWQESSVVFLNVNNKKLEERKASNQDGCDLNEIEFNNATFYTHRFYKFDSYECKKSTQKKAYVLKGNTFETEFVRDDYIELNEYEIILSTSTKLILKTTVDWYYGGKPKDAFYMETTYIKK